MKIFKNKVSKYTVLCIAVVVAFATQGYCAKKAYSMPQGLMHSVESAVTNDSALEKVKTGRKSCQLDSLPHNVLCIGNSITLHQPLDDVNWYSNHGMAASKPEYDYVHMLEKMMRKHNPKTTVTPMNLSAWERNFSINIDSLLKEKCRGKDIIVIRIGENVHGSDIPMFADALSKLIEYCRQYTKRIILTGEYWPVLEKEQAVVQNARKYHLKYVPIDWIWNSYREECSPKEGDTLYDTAGKPYRIKGEFILTHPNDKGMELIATSIYNTL